MYNRENPKRLRRDSETPDLPPEMLDIIFTEIIQADCTSILSLRLTSVSVKQFINNICRLLLIKNWEHMLSWMEGQQSAIDSSRVFVKLNNSEHKRIYRSYELIEKLLTTNMLNTGDYFVQKQIPIPKSLTSEDSRLFGLRREELAAESSMVLDRINLNDALITTRDKYMFPQDIGSYMMSAINLRAFELLYMLIRNVNSKKEYQISLKRLLGAIYYQAAADYQSHEFAQLIYFFPIENINAHICYRYPFVYRKGTLFASQSWRYESLLTVAQQHDNQDLVGYLRQLGAYTTPRIMPRIQQFRQGNS